MLEIYDLNEDVIFDESLEEFFEIARRRQTGDVWGSQHGMSNLTEISLSEMDKMNRIEIEWVGHFLLHPSLKTVDLKRFRGPKICDGLCGLD